GSADRLRTKAGAQRGAVLADFLKPIWRNQKKQYISRFKQQADDLPTKGRTFQRNRRNTYKPRIPSCAARPNPPLGRFFCDRRVTSTAVCQHVFQWARCAGAEDIRQTQSENSGCCAGETSFLA